MAELNGAPVGVAEMQALALTNYGHFTTMRVEGGGVRGLSRHLDRLVRNCRAVFDADLDPDRVRDLVRHAIDGHAGPVVVRVTVFDPALSVARPATEATPDVLVTTRAAADGEQPPLRLRSAVYRRDTPEVKHVGLYGALRLRRAAQRDGYDDVVFTSPDGAVSELATSNLGTVRDGQLVWPSEPHLPGVTMRLLDQAWGASVRYEPVTLADLATADAVFATNATIGVRAVTSIDGTDRPQDHPALRELRARYRETPFETM
ncbi:aminotransferase class IV family protein [Saccharomonospora halophila]|uniref:aminotransferase class IV family protein n=1 Tax=Saccharomonospora halophila TaxID=129922 RepID=UPI00037955B3|nr:aminotransferase class IV family protein [Saccharomonospora halophila]